MYYPANDNELIYLIKDGNSVAHRALYLKYMHLISILYKVSPYSEKIPYADFQQECLLCLEQAIYKYRECYSCSFYTYYRMVASRNIHKLLRNDGICLKERYTEYSSIQTIEKKLKFYPLEFKKYRDIPFENALEQDLLEEYILGNASLKALAKKHNMEYTHIYYRYKKFKEKLEKLLTNELV